MSLFIGNVSKKVTQKQFQDAFKAYGKCKVDLRKRFAFVQFESERNAQQAKKELQNMNLCGLKLNIQWSKNSGRFTENNKNKSGRRRSRSRDRSWRREDRWRHRSPDYQKRSEPTLSENQDFQDFVPRCPRDYILLKKLKIKKQEGQILQERERQPKGQMKDENEQKKLRENLSKMNVQSQGQGKQQGQA